MAEETPDPFSDAIAFMVLNGKTEDGFFRCDLKGFYADYEYGLKMELKSSLTGGMYKFQGPGALIFRSVGERSDRVLQALGTKLGLTPGKTFKPEVSLDDLCTLGGDAAEIANAPVEFKGFLDGGTTEFYVDMDLQKGLVVLRPRHGGEPAVLAALSAG